MSLYETLIDLGRKPSGLIGRLIGALMNIGHKDAYAWGLSYVLISPNSIVLDVGCGGGGAIRILSEKAAEGKVYGIDHSIDMVRLARHVNKRFIESGRVEINHGSVSQLPYSENMFDTVTAFETIEFWPNLSEDFKEVIRLLKPGGVLLIVNRHSRAEKKESKWAKFQQINTSNEYRKRLEDAGYIGILIDDHSRKGWIVVVAKRPQGAA
jgi:ubiquinone/menaquinone biosynthesis C-methylase UbiE